jgi:hypothetical protein
VIAQTFVGDSNVLFGGLSNPYFGCPRRKAQEFRRAYNGSKDRPDEAIILDHPAARQCQRGLRDLFFSKEK